MSKQYQPQVPFNVPFKHLKRKLESCVSLHEKKKLRNRIYTTDRSCKKSDYFKRTLDIIHEAVYMKKKISFIYADSILYSDEIRKKKHSYVVSPYVISCNDGRFFLIALPE